jgi:MOSC domain-containing protein YiiM
MNMRVLAVSKSDQHNFSKKNEESIYLIANFGVEGDAHAGKTIQHLFLTKKDPTRKNIRQVHLIQIELLSELNNKGFSVTPGQLGENITTQGIDLLSLPVESKLHIGKEAIIELTALRNPCVQIENFQKGILKEVVSKDVQGNVIRKIGVMGIVLKGGRVTSNDVINIEFPELPHKNLEYIW